MAKEIRITFKEKESDLYDYIQSKSSASAFLKDLARLEQKREEIYLGKTTNTIIIKEEKKETNDVYEESTIDLDDVDISDLEEF